jgi:hypothetical protein
MHSPRGHVLPAILLLTAVLLVLLAPNSASDSESSDFAFSAMPALLRRAMRPEQLLLKQDADAAMEGREPAIASGGTRRALAPAWALCDALAVLLQLFIIRTSSKQRMPRKGKIKSAHTKACMRLACAPAINPP